jgi:hypothetical protein
MGRQEWNPVLGAKRGNSIAEVEIAGVGVTPCAARTAAAVFASSILTPACANSCASAGSRSYLPAA